MELRNGGVVAGIHNIPPRSASLQFRPLLVALHGGTYDCHYFDADDNHTASISSNAYGIPFVSIDRPCYGGTSSFLPVPEGSSFPRETGNWLHKYILPVIWSEFGTTNDCNCIVLLSHSLGVMSGIAAVALHGQDDNPLYPLGGIICSGLGDVWQSHMKENLINEPNLAPDHFTMPLHVKDATMFVLGTVHPDILALTEQLHLPAPFPEYRSLSDHWLPNWKSEWAVHVKVPIMFALVERDCFFEVSEERLLSCAKAFSNSVYVDSSLVKYAPHCMEISYWSQAWYARCFGLAIEYSIDFSLE